MLNHQSNPICTYHSAILARSLGIPAVVGASPAILNLTNGTLSALDGENGRVWIQPDTKTLAALRAKQDRAIATQQQAQAKAQEPAITCDARQVNIFAN